MSYKVLTIPPFDKQLKRLIKKYPSLKKEFVLIVTDITRDPKKGDALGNNCFKMRIAIASKGKGKSGGARVILNIAIANSLVYLIAIYDKSEQASLNNQELLGLLKYIE